MQYLTLADRGPYFFVLNGGAGKHSVDETRQLIDQVMGGAGLGHTVHVVQDPARLPTLAKATVRQAQARKGIVVIAGGDGSINAMAHACLGSGCPMGVLPSGTFNYFAREHRIPEDTEAALRLMIGGRARPVQVGRVNERIFLVNASMGLYPQLLEDREAFKKRYGRSRLVAWVAGLATLLKPHRQLRLEIERPSDTRQVTTPMLFVSNSRLQLEQMGLQEDLDRAADGLLAALMPKPVGTAGLLGLALRGAVGSLGDAERLDHFQVRRMRVQAGGRLHREFKVATDGEVTRMRGPLNFSVASETLWLIQSDEVADTEPMA